MDIRRPHEHVGRGVAELRVGSPYDTLVREVLDPAQEPSSPIAAVYVEIKVANGLLTCRSSCRYVAKSVLKNPCICIANIMSPCSLIFPVMNSCGPWAWPKISRMKSISPI